MNELNIDLSTKTLREQKAEQLNGWTHSKYTIESSKTKVYIFDQGMFSKPVVKGPDFVRELRQSGIFRSGNLLPNGIMKIGGESVLVCPTEEGTTTVLDALKIGGMQAPNGGVKNGLVLRMPILVIPNNKSWKKEAEDPDNQVISQAVVARLAGAYYKYTGEKII
jgi:hypothetical protein